jgi:hypothetical protein
MFVGQSVSVYSGVQFMRRFALGLVVAAVMGVGLAHAQVSVRGAQSCGVWAKDRGVHEKAWLVGYLSGVAMVTNRNFVEGTDSNSMYLWMDKYCRENPLKDMADGAYALYQELARSKGMLR